MMKEKIKKKIKIVTIYFVQYHLNQNIFINYLAFVPPQSTLYQLVSFVFVCLCGEKELGLFAWDFLGELFVFMGGFFCS